MAKKKPVEKKAPAEPIPTTKLIMAGAVALVGTAIVVALQQSEERPQPVPVPIAAGTTSASPGASATAEGPAKLDPSAIEFELLVGDKPHDVAGKSIEIAPGTKVDLVPVAPWTWIGEGFSFEHPPDIGIKPGSAIIVADQGAQLQIFPHQGDAAEEQMLELLSKTYRKSGQVDETPTATKRTINGVEANGRRYVGKGGLWVEIFAPQMGEGLRMGLVLIRTMRGAKTDRLERVMESVRPGKVEPKPLFRLSMGKSSAELIIDKPVELDVDGKKVEVKLRRRANVLRSLKRMRFEHPNAFAFAEVPNEAATMVTLSSEVVQVTIIATDLKLDGAQVKAALLRGTPTRDKGKATRELGDEKYEGEQLAVQMGGDEVHTEVFIFTRGSTTFATMLQFDEADEAKVLELAGPILTSLR